MLITIHLSVNTNPGIHPLLKTKNDYSFDLIKDKVVFQYSDKKDFYNFLKKLKKKKYLLNNIYNKLWKSTNKDLDLKKILS